MLGRVLRASRCATRNFSRNRAVWDEFGSNLKKFSSPEEFRQNQLKKELEDQVFQQSMLEKEFEYRPKFLTENKVNSVTKRPIPLNVELLKYKPIQVPKTFGHEVVKLDFRGYDRENLITAVEFAARAAFYLNIPCSKMMNLKTEKRLYTVIKSPFAQAKSKENFKRTTYGFRLQAYDATPDVVDLWLSFVNKHAVEGVKYEANITVREGLDFSEKLDKLSGDDLRLPQAYAGSDDPITKKVEELLKSDTFKEYLEENKASETSETQ